MSSKDLQKTPESPLPRYRQFVNNFSSFIRNFSDPTQHRNSTQDSEVTSFIYHKILAIEFIICIFTIVSIIICILMMQGETNYLSDTRSKYLLAIFTFLTILANLLQTKCKIQWNIEKKEADTSPFNMYVEWLVESVLILPSPSFFIPNIDISLYDYSTGSSFNIPLDSILSCYTLFRILYILKFLVHSESYYGSRPDRLSRIYTVRFGTFNAIKYLINQKPFWSFLVLYLMTTLALPLGLNIIEGNYNSNLKNYMSCLYFTLICQSTVGYGELLPITIIGRIIALLMTFSGTVFSSLVLIFVIKSLAFSSMEEDAHFRNKIHQIKLLHNIIHVVMNQLITKREIRSALVRRIEEEWNYIKSRGSQSQMIGKRRDITNFRIQNRRLLRLTASEPANVRRLMNKNFTEIIKQVQYSRDQQQLLLQYCNVIAGSMTTINNSKLGRKLVKRHSKIVAIEEQIVSNRYPGIGA